jgi:putative exosortase-associated protein (TIGR04073 family)
MARKNVNGTSLGSYGTQEGTMKRTCLAVAFVLAFAPLAHADTHRDDSALTRETAGAKAGRGLMEMITGFLEFPGNIYAETRDDGLASGLTIGFAKGIGMIPVRELVGVYEFVTAPIEVPDDYEPVLDPPLPWQYFEGSDSADASRTVRK